MDKKVCKENIGLMREKHPRRRGYPTAVLIGLKEEQTAIWRIYSETVRLHLNIHFENNKEEKTTYNNYESIVDVIRTVLNEGITCIIIVSTKRSLIENFKNHIEKHHKWVFNYEITLTYIEDEGVTPNEVARLVKSKRFKEALMMTRIIESSELLKVFEEGVRNDQMFYTIEELYKSLKMEVKINRIFMTDDFLRSNIKNRWLESAQQLCRNLGVKVHIITKDSKLGIRLSQFGGLVFFR